MNVCKRQQELNDILHYVKRYIFKDKKFYTSATIYKFLNKIKYGNCVHTHSGSKFPGKISTTN